MISHLEGVALIVFAVVMVGGGVELVSVSVDCFHFILVTKFAPDAGVMFSVFLRRKHLILVSPNDIPAQWFVVPISPAVDGGFKPLDGRLIRRVQLFKISFNGAHNHVRCWEGESLRVDCPRKERE